MNVPKDALTIEKAKAWYEMQKTTPVMMLKSSKADKKADCTPDWEKAFASSNDNLEVVEAPLTAQSHFSFYTKESLELLKVNNEQGYLNSNSRIVIQKNKKTGLREDYIMTIIGDADYLKTKKCQLTKNTYLKKDKDFSGYVLFHNSDGVFVNGWQFNKGKVIATMTLTSSDQPTLRLKVAAPIGSYGSSTDCYSTSVYMIYDVTDYIHQISYVEYDYLYSYTVCYSSGGDGLAAPSGGGGTPGNTNPSDPAPDAIVTNLSANQCVQKIYNALMAQNTLNCATTSFLGSSSDCLFWNISTLADPLEDAFTTSSPYSQSSRISVTISLNSCMLDRASGVYIAVTMIHEALHAMMYNELIASGGYANLQRTDPKLYDIYSNFKTGTTIIGDYQHNNMAANYRQTIIKAINDYDAAFPGAVRSQDELDALSWSGLMGTDAYFNNFLSIFTATPATLQKNTDYRNILYGQNGLRYSKENNDVNNCITSTKNISVE
jgi:hypothetical protein